MRNASPTAQASGALTRSDHVATQSPPVLPDLSDPLLHETPSHATPSLCAAVGLAAHDVATSAFLHLAPLHNVVRKARRPQRPELCVCLCVCRSSPTAEPVCSVPRPRRRTSGHIGGRDVRDLALFYS